LPENYNEFLESDEEKLNKLKEIIDSEEEYDLFRRMQDARENGDFEKVKEIMDELGIGGMRPQYLP
jgi:hypothetical protein